MIGRKSQIEAISQDLDRNEAQLIAIYGRRRIGKTYLVRKYFNDRFTFRHSGILGGSMTEQLSAFRGSLVKCGYDDCPVLESWQSAFDHLRRFLESGGDVVGRELGDEALGRGGASAYREDGGGRPRRVVFIDELPWMDTPGSRFVMWLDHFWNSWASAQDDIALIVCGSATSWIIDKIVKDRGGLHNRLTDQIRLQPFSLHDCEEYSNALGLSMKRMDIAECYMVFGGVPYYWSLLKRGRSVAQNIDELLFARTGRLRLEYSQLYSSLFRNSERHIAIVDALASRQGGMTRKELADAVKTSLGGNFGAVLEELEQCDFIRSYCEPGRKTRGAIYQLMDNFTLFHRRFMSDGKRTDPHFWQNSLNTPAVNTWHGLAFERLCLHHVPQIRKALGISGVLTNTYAWRHVADDVHPTGVQIDLLLDRADRLVNVCEMKWAAEPFAITKEYAEKLRLKAGVYSSVATKGRKGANITLVAPFGVADNMYRFTPQSVVTLDDLFEEVRQ